MKLFLIFPPPKKTITVNTMVILSDPSYPKFFFPVREKVSYRDSEVSLLAL